MWHYRVTFASELSPQSHSQSFVQPMEQVHRHLFPLCIVPLWLEFRRLQNQMLDPRNGQLLGDTGLMDWDKMTCADEPMANASPSLVTPGEQTDSNTRQQHYVPELSFCSVCSKHLISATCCQLHVEIQKAQVADSGMAANNNHWRYN